MKQTVPNCIVKNKIRRNVTRNFNWNVLYNKCRLCLYRDFTEGKSVFLKILNAPENEYCTAKPGMSAILQTVKKDYVSIEEAENDLNNKFMQAVNFENQGIHIIKAQTGIGKTNLYLEYLKKTDKNFLIAVPTHKLKMEVYNKAISKGIRNIAYTPEMPEFTPEVQEKINHIYAVGAGKYALDMMSEIFDEIPTGHSDYKAWIAYVKVFGKFKDFEVLIQQNHFTSIITVILRLFKKNGFLVKK